MARKLYFNKAASTGGGATTGVAVQGGTGGFTILLIFVPVLAFILYSKSKGGKSASAEQTPEEKKKADEAEKVEKKKKDDEAKKKEKKEKKAKIYHCDPEGKGIVDPEWDALKLAHPNNPFYEATPMPEGWTGENTVTTPVYKTSEEERANKKGAHHPYASGRILPRPKIDKGVKFITEEGQQPVDGLAKIDPFNVIPERRPVGEFEYRPYEGSYKGPAQNRGGGVRAGSKAFFHLTLARNKDKFIELTKSLGEAPVSMSAENVNALLEAVEIVTENPSSDPTAHRPAMAESWNSQHGTYPEFVNAPLAILESMIKPQAMKDLVDGLSTLPAPKRQKYTRYGLFLKERLGLTVDPKKNPPGISPKMLLYGWFFDHFRLWKRDHRICIAEKGLQYENPPTPDVKIVYPLMTWLEVLGASCAQHWILSARGWDFPGLAVRMRHLPLVPTPLDPNRIFDYSAVIFLPTHSEMDPNGRKEWIDRAQKHAKGINAAMSVVDNTRLDYMEMRGVKEPDAYRTLTFRPGWSLGAVQQSGDLANAFEIGAAPKENVNDGRLFLHEWDKGMPGDPGPGAMYSIFHTVYRYVQPEIVRFCKRPQYSWSSALTSQIAGFQAGQIAMCLGSLSTELNKSRNVHDGFWEDDNHANKADFIKMLDFGDSIPLETETKEGVKTYSFPSLLDFAVLEAIYLPYVSLVPEEANPTPQTCPECTATLALHDDLGLYKQLDEKRGKLELVVICRDGKDPDGKDYTAEQWCGRLELELKVEAAKYGRKYEDYKDLIKWTKDDGVAPNTKKPMPLVAGDVSMWRMG